MMMVVNPNSLTAITEYKGQTNATGNNMTQNNNGTGNVDVD